jgi:aldose 1-epimerase
MITIEKELFGKVNGEDVFLFTLKNKHGMTMRVTNYGGIVTSLIVPDKDGEFHDVVLGFDNLQGYLEGHPYFGCIVGRYANRIANGEFTLDGDTYHLERNNGENHLHGGIEGFDKKLWHASWYESDNEAGLKLTSLSPDGEEGYPGNMETEVLYSLTNDNEFKIHYYAATDAPTVVNLTHHSYFNLNGQGNGDILDHSLYINAERYTPITDLLIPTGKLSEVEGGPFDFRDPKSIRQDFNQVEGGYDHNFVLGIKDTISLAASLSSPVTGISMEVFTDQPGMQFYSGNFLDGSLKGKNGKVYKQHYGLCLETQHFPDSPNQPGFPSTVLRPGQAFKSTTIYRFSNK